LRIVTYALLRAQTCYSILDSTIEPRKLARAAAERGIPAVALTDRGVLHAAMGFSAACLEVGVQPIVGVLLPVVRPVPDGRLRPGQGAPVDWLPLLVQDEEGHANLLSLVSEAHLSPASLEGPALALDRLSGRTAGLLALTGGADGACARLAAEGQEFADVGERLLALFRDRLVVEIGRSGEPIEAQSEDALLDWAEARGLPIVGTSVAKFLEPDDHLAHDVMLCIAEGAYLESVDRRRSNPEQSLLDPEAFAARFSDLPEAVANTLMVARRSAFACGRRAPVLPKLVADEAEERETLDRLAEDGLARRLERMDGDPGPYRERLAYELSVIHRMGFSGYFLIVADFIGWAKARGIPVGPGRGSGAGSVVAWALRITDLDPLRFGLLFERFLNPERRSMPDFDIDFCETRRDEVIRYVQEKYGRDRVAQIITFGTLKARAVVKDVGRVLQMPYGEVDRIAKIIPNHPADPWDLERTIRDAPEMRAAMADPRIDRLITIARTLEGRPRHSSTHAAGVVIGDRPLDRLVPLLKDPRSDFPVTQYDLKYCEDAGLVKFDFLGLKTLSVLARAVQLLAAQGISVDLDALPLEDDETFALLTRGDTVGVFQFESEGMRRALSLVKPTLFEDLIALGALYRPGPMDNIPSFAARKWGREAVDWLHPTLEPILKPTYGIIIYQEQVMQIAQVLAGYSLGEADLLRRAMGKKIKAEMDAQEQRFVEGAVARGVERGRARHIFELVEKFAGYGFNKSHAAAYALVAWKTAWLKAHHPAAFYAATMAYDIHDTDKLKILVDDMRRANVPLLPPDVNASDADFALERVGAEVGVRYALGAVKGVGTAAMAEMVRERARGGPFRSLEDWAGRVEPRALNKRQVEALAAAGVFDGLCEKGALERSRVLSGADALLAAAIGAAREREEGQGGLFGGPAGAVAGVPLPHEAPWRLPEALAHERAAFGFYWSGHPVDAHAQLLDAQGVVRSDRVLERRARPGAQGQSVMMAGLVEEVAWRTPAGKGADRRFLTVDFSDAGGRWGGTCFDPPTQQRLIAAAETGQPMLVSVELGWRDGDEAPRLRIASAAPLDEVAARTRLLFRVRLEAGAQADDVVALLRRLPRGGRSEVIVEVPVGGGFATVRLGRDFRLPGGVDEEFRTMGQVASAGLESAGGPLRLVA
jgi:DNA polymerase-3 subunit alpha